jgi:hypothetical protein
MFLTFTSARAFTTGIYTVIRIFVLSWVWWLTPVISTIRKLRKEGHEFKASLANIARPSLKEAKQPA